MAVTPGTDVFGSLADTEAYFTRLGRADEWDAVGDDAAKEGAKRWAALLLTGSLEYHGWPEDEDQALPFPRYGLLTRNGSYLPTGTIPQEMKDAESELALILGSGTDTEAANALGDLGIIRDGTTGFTGGAIRRVIPERVMERIPRAWIKRGANPATVGLDRV